MLRLFKIFVATLFLSVNFGALLYVNSSFLEKFFSQTSVSLLFLAGAVANIGLFLIAPKLLNLFGKKWLFFASLLCLSGANLALALGTTRFALGVAFVAYSALLYIAYYCIDIFLEEGSDDTRTGEVRGVYFTIMNAGIALGPLLLSVLPDGEHYRRVYWLALLLLAVPGLISFWLLLTKKHVHKVKPRSLHLLPFKQWMRQRNIRAVTLAKTVLETFFAIMVIFTPIYAHQVVGIARKDLSIIFSIALLPFVFLEWPAGELADRKWGEKEMMTAGFFITGVALLSIPFLPKNLFIWALVLFLSRVGAALVEIMCETYFFKQIGASDTGLISIFRLARPTGNVIGALVGAATLALVTFPHLFFILAIVVFFGMKESLFLKDTL